MTSPLRAFRYLSPVRPPVTEGGGQGIGLIDCSKSAQLVVQELREDFADAIEHMMALVEYVAFCDTRYGGEVYSTCEAKKNIEN